VLHSIEKGGDKCLNKKMIYLIAAALCFLMYCPVVFAASNEHPFSDTVNHWAEESIKTLQEEGVIDGFEDGTFHPQGGITREQFVKLLVVERKYLLSYPDTRTFSDVTNTRWSFSYIETAITNGVILKGDYGAAFDPASAISRSEMSIMITRALHLESTSKVAPFKDQVDIQRYPELIAAAASNAIVQGYEDGSFRPNNHATRAEASTILLRAHTYQRVSSNAAIEREGVIHLTSQQVKSGVGGKIGLQNAPEMKAGSVIVLPPDLENPLGSVYKVTEIKSEGVEQMLGVTQPDISEVVKSIDVNKDVSVSVENLIPSSVPDGVVITSLEPQSVAILASRKGKMSVSNKNGIQVKFKDFNLGKLDGQFPVRLDGDLKIPSPTADVDAKIDFDNWKVDHFNVFFSAQFEGTTKITVAGPLGKKMPLVNKPISFAKFVVPISGPIGVEVKLSFIVKADMTVGIVANISNQTLLAGGFEWKDGQKISLNQSSSESDLRLEVQGEVAAQAGPMVGVYLDVFSFETGGIELSGGLKGDGKGKIGCYKAELDAFIKGDAVLVAPKFIEIKSLSWNLFNQDWVLKRQNTCLRSMTDREVYDFIKTAENTVSEIIVKELNTAKPKPYEQIKPEIEKYYTSNYQWGNLYTDNFGWFYEPYGIYPITESLESSFKVVNRDLLDGTITATIKRAPSNFNMESSWGASLYTFTLLFDENSDSWRIDSVKNDKLTEPFTPTEADAILTRELGVRLREITSLGSDVKAYKYKFVPKKDDLYNIAGYYDVNKITGNITIAKF
jgi:hypothetical protein